MPFNSLIANPGRLQILTSLAAGERMDFVELRRVTALTDGNLSSHAKRLASAGLIEMEKTFREGKPVTSFALTADGRRRLGEHVTALMEAMRARGAVQIEAATDEARSGSNLEEEWID